MEPVRIAKPMVGVVTTEGEMTPCNMGLADQAAYAMRGGSEAGGTPRSFNGYMARGVSEHRVVDDGTIVPTAAGGSIPFAPEVTIPALMAMRSKYGARLYTRYGFKDAINPSFTFTEFPSRSGEVDVQKGWVAGDYIGIDQGPILAMMENHRSGLVWKVMRKNPHIQRGLKRIGFTGGWLDDAK